RCIFILGTMFKIDSRIAGDILEMTPEAYRQRLSRIRKKMADFLSEYCGEYGSGRCKCKDRVNYAIQSHRINPLQLDYMAATEIPVQTVIDVKNAMEDIDDLSQDFSFCKTYQSPERMKHLIQEFLDSTQLSIIQKA
ncbi:MAG: RNA polymerase subunit sigma-24, partial [Lachnospiraceae bacterium]|nr:RNA polymerase subunit sigma-24 [Lachnospiraceae bacterium]